MKMKPSYLALLVSCLIASMPLSASTDKKDIYISDNKLDRISVEWIEPKSFTDVRQANFSSAKFRKHVFNQLEKHLSKLAKDLPKGQVINFKITDLDMAGSVEPASIIGLSSSMEDVRVMRNIDIPRIKFEYELVDASGAVIKSAEVKLKDMNYLNDIRFSSRNKPYEHEKRMLSKWFSKNIIDAQA